MLNIVKGKIDRALKVVVYGTEGIGKSTFASKFPQPLFIDVEGGTAQMDIQRIETPASWEELLSDIKEVAATPDVCRTLVIDTADWCEQLCITHICQKYKQSGLESFGFGKGYSYVGKEFARLLATCDAVIASGKNVVIIAHAKQRKIELPDEAGAFDHYEMKLTRQSAPLLKEWADLLLFMNYQTYVVTTETNSRKATGGKRVMYASHSPVFDAKNRHGLPDVMDLDFAAIAHLFGNAAPAPAEPKPIDQLRALMVEAGIADAQLQKVVASKGHYPEDAAIDTYEDKFITGWCIKHFAAITNMIKEDQNNG